MSKVPTLLLVEDNAADVLIVQRALRETGIPVDLVVKRDGQEAISYLLRQDDYAADPGWRVPTLVLLDLNLPRLTGRQVIERIRSSGGGLRALPVVVLTTSNRKEDVSQMYTAGANSFLTKPNSFAELVQHLRVLLHYWLQIVQLPQAGHA